MNSSSRGPAMLVRSRAVGRGRGGEFEGEGCTLGMSPNRAWLGAFSIPSPRVGWELCMSTRHVRQETDGI